jgi:hypothetical protein
MGKNDLHLVEMLLRSKLHGRADALRVRYPFSEDIEATNAILFNPKYDKRRKVRAYRAWLQASQPCVFGRVAAKNKNIFICLLEESEILRMKSGDKDLKDTLQDYRQVWKRNALEGLASSFVVVLVSPSLAIKEPNSELKEIARRLIELYMELDTIEDDTFQTQREYLFLKTKSADRDKTVLKFSTLPNIFCAQGDRRWWHDHRTPGGLMITSNALGHFVYSRTRTYPMEDKDKAWALENAMRTISNAYRGPLGGKGHKTGHCPATFLVPAAATEPSPLKDSSEFRKYSADRYKGYFHTDHLIPSVYFRKERDPADLKLNENLSLRYIYDSRPDPDEHAELMTGVKASWYDVRRNMDRLPDFANPESKEELTIKTRARLAQWLLARLKSRLS